MAAGALQVGGLIRWSRGHVLVLDHHGVEAAACHCYRIIQESQGRTDGQPSVRCRTFVDALTDKLTDFCLLSRLSGY